MRFVSMISSRPPRRNQLQFRSNLANHRQRKLRPAARYKRFPGAFEAAWSVWQLSGPVVDVGSRCFLGHSVTLIAFFSLSITRARRRPRSARCIRHLCRPSEMRDFWSDWFVLESHGDCLSPWSLVRRLRTVCRLVVSMDFGLVGRWLTTPEYTDLDRRTRVAARFSVLAGLGLSSSKASISRGRCLLLQPESGITGKPSPPENMILVGCSGGNFWRSDSQIVEYLESG